MTFIEALQHIKGYFMKNKIDWFDLMLKILAGVVVLFSLTIFTCGLLFAVYDLYAYVHCLHGYSCRSYELLNATYNNVSVKH